MMSHGIRVLARNTEIITYEKLENGVTEQVHTFMEWKYRGYRIKKGQHALIKTRLWKKVKAKDEDEEDRFILVKAYLFGESQVEKVGG